MVAFQPVMIAQDNPEPGLFPVPRWKGKRGREVEEWLPVIPVALVNSI
jgi:hypothetical protein